MKLIFDTISFVVNDSKNGGGVLKIMIWYTQSVFYRFELKTLQKTIRSRAEKRRKIICSTKINFLFIERSFFFPLCGLLSSEQVSVGRKNGRKFLIRLENVLMATVRRFRSILC